MKKYFRVKYGYGLLDSVSVEEGDLKKAIYAQSTRKPVQLGNAFISGANIISITPDYHHYTGWNQTYNPNDNDDLLQIERDCPNFDGVLEWHKDRVREIMSNGQLQLLSNKEEYIVIDAPQNSNIGFELAEKMKV